MSKLACFSCLIIALNIVFTSCVEQFDEITSPATFNISGEYIQVDEKIQLFFSTHATFSEHNEKYISPTIKHTNDSPASPKSADQPKPRPSGSQKNSRFNSTKTEKPSRTDVISVKNDKSLRSGFANSRPLKQQSKPKLNITSRMTDSYVPHGDRGIQLTFAETGEIKVFMMVRGNAFIQLDGEAIPTFQLR